MGAEDTGDKTLEDEIGELDWAGPEFDGEAETAEAETPEVPPVEDMVETPEVVVDPPEAVEPPPPPPPPPVDDDMVTYLRGQVEQLNRQLLEASNQRQAPLPKQDALPQAKVPVAPLPTPPAPSEEYDYTGGIDLDDITTDPKIFNDILKKVEERVRMAVSQEAAQSALLSIPDVVQHQIKQQAALNKLVEVFYEENEDLRSVNHTVGMVAQNLSTEHPDWTVKQVFDSAAAQTRTLLRMPAPAENKTPTEPLKPAFAKRPGGRDRTSESVNISALQKQLDEL